MKDNKKDLTLETFKFEARDVYFKLMNDMKLNEKFKDSFNYLLTKMPIQKLKKDLSKLKWDEGKSYDWAIIENDGVFLIIRKYRTHFTIFFKYKTKITDNSDFDEYYYSKYGCFTFDINKDKVENSDRYYDNNFLCLNEYINPLFELIKKGNVCWLWNPLSFKKPDEIRRPDYIDVKNIWDGCEDISSIDLFLFACEELFSKYLEIFAQTDMLEKIKTFKIGDRLDAYEITGVTTEFSKMYSDPYYHGVGLSMKNTNFPDTKDSFNDVYCLSRYYYEYIFPKSELKK